MVFGDVIQISQVTGDVVVQARMPPPYRIEVFSTEADPLPRDLARAQPSRLLLPRHRVVPFAGRDDQLDDLAGWAADTATPVRLLHAPGGQGKTRLAGEFARRCGGQDWAVWRVTHSAPAGVTTSSRVPLPPDGKVLVLVDYADRWPPSHLLALLGDLVNIAVQAPLTLRVLLLARSTGYWWPAVTSRLDGDFGVTADDVPLAPLPTTLDRAELFTTAAAHFADALGSGNGWPDPSGLDRPAYTQVLAVHMAALVAVEARRRDSPVPATPHAVSAFLLRREYEHWQRMSGRAEDPLLSSARQLHRTTCLATLAGPLPRPAAQEILTRSGLAGTVPDADQLIDDHRVCQPAADPVTVLEALRPDRLGEDLIALTTPGHAHIGADVAGLADDWALTAPAAVAGAGDTPAWAAGTVTVLTETAHRWPHIATGVLYPLVSAYPEWAVRAGGATLTRLAEIPGVDPDVLAAVEPLLPATRDVDLDIAAAAITGRLTRHRLDRTTDPAEQARLYSVHALCLSSVGQDAEALEPAKKATALYRRLALLPELAVAVGNLGGIMAGLGRLEQALALAEESVGLLRKLAGTAPETHSPALAIALTNLGVRLAETGRREEALAPSEEAVAIQRRLARADREHHLPFLAVTLSNLGVRLSEIGRPEHALRPAQEATRILRRLAKAEPQRFLPELAASLLNLGVRMAELGRRRQALPPTAEGIALFRRLVEANPRVHLPALAGALANLGVWLSQLGRTEEALPPSEEAVAAYRRLAEADPLVHRPFLAVVLMNLGARLAEVSRTEQALAPTEEAVAILRGLADASPQSYLRPFATAVGNHAVLRAELGHSKAALGAAREAVTVHRRLARSDPAERLGLAGALEAYAAVCAEFGADQRGALESVDEAIQIYRPLAHEQPDMFTEALMGAYLTGTDVLERFGRFTEAALLRREIGRLTNGPNRGQGRR
ncbi:tetratricopeptide repeat protein [Actinoplanes sp. NEAU-H7]|uniref:Tetratricopeptide repeat protein n=1 Tax=Actinoplanes flavus TaxID=2820290 RepID=A0ABS3UEN5_9ACTN|nr:tetratricopeptide repeat protein [Actinoplanes flavus]